MVGVTALAGITLAVMGGYTYAEHEDFKGYLESQADLYAAAVSRGDHETEADIVEGTNAEAERGLVLAHATDALIGITAAAAAATVVLGVLAFLPSRDAEVEASVAAVPSLSGGLVMAGLRF
jgi:hypothetical protein